MIHIWGPKDKSPKGVEVINTTSRSINWSRGLSPFLLGPCELYNDYVATNVENAWQFCKVYQEHATNQGDPTDNYFEWALSGWSNHQAIRYPMGKGKKPLYSWWNGEKLGYVEARKKIYVPIYAKAVLQSDAYATLRELYKKNGELHLWDFDGYDYIGMNMTFKDVINNPNRSMGHAFVIANLLMKGY
jgi:hypothetical protein